MNRDQQIRDRFDQLIAQGNQVARTETRGNGMPARVDPGAASQWANSTLHLLRSVFGDSSTHVTKFAFKFDQPWSPSGFEPAFGSLKAAKDDYEHGMLFNARTLIEAEVFDDFLEQAEALHSAGYYQAAAVVAGAVLEDGLRKLCAKNDIPLSDKPKLEWMNQELARHQVYGKLTQKQIAASADVRNKAAHGEWDKFNKDDVAQMLQQVRAFMAQHFS